MFLRACVHRLGDRDRHFARLAEAEADAARAVADHGQRGEAELAAALDDLGRAIDRDSFSTNSSPDLRLFRLRSRHIELRCAPYLELETRFARRIGQRLDATVDTGNPNGRTRPCSTPAALARSAIACRRPSAASMLPVPFKPSRTVFCTVDAAASTLSPVGIDHLRVDVLRRAMHGQARPRRSLRMCARVLTARRRRRCSFLS